MKKKLHSLPHFKGDKPDQFKLKIAKTRANSNFLTSDALYKITTNIKHNNMQTAAGITENKHGKFAWKR